MNNIEGEGQEIHPKVCIIILNWNGLEDTIECLESLKKVTYPDYEVILVDNGSEGNDVEILRERFGDHIQIIENDKNYGFAEGCNIGMRYALENSDPDNILLLNNDTAVDPDFLTELVKVAESDSLIGIVGPKVCFYHEPNVIQSAGGQINWWTGQASLIGCTQFDKEQFDEIREVDWVSGCALLIKRKVIEQVGLLYAPYFAYFEEAEWCTRVTRAGYEVIYVPKAHLWHKSQFSISRTDGLPMYHMSRNRFLFMKRNSTRLQFISFLVYFFLKDFLLSSVLILARQKDPKLLLSFYRGTYDGINLTLKGYKGEGWKT